MGTTAKNEHKTMSEVQVGIYKERRGQQCKDRLSFINVAFSLGFDYVFFSVSISSSATRGAVKGHSGPFL